MPQLHPHAAQALDKEATANLEIFQAHGMRWRHSRSQGMRILSDEFRLLSKEGQNLLCSRTTEHSKLRPHGIALGWHFWGYSLCKL
jgi:hypothetical protein